MKRVASVAVVVALLIGVGGATAAHAADGEVVTVKGHIYDDLGKPIAGIKAFSDCGCDSESGFPAFSSGSDVTSASGYFSFQVLKSSARYVSLEDPKGRYITTSVSHFRKIPGGLVTKKTMYLGSEIAGTVVDDAGKPAKNAQIHVFDAATGKTFRIADNQTNSKGRFHAIVPGGTYKVRFSGINDTYAAEWFGDVASRVDSPSVTVKRGGKTAGINAVVTKQYRIAGEVRVAGESRIFGRGDVIGYRVHDATGAIIATDVAEGYFFATKLLPGAYTIEFYPLGTNFFVPQTVAYTITTKDINADKLSLASVPASSADKRSAVFAWGGPALTAQRGERYSTDISVLSYGDPTGGTVTFYAGGKKLDSATVPTTGKVTLSTRFSGVSSGTKSIYAEFSGTDTVLPAKYAMFEVKITS